MNTLAISPKLWTADNKVTIAIKKTLGTRFVITAVILNTHYPQNFPYTGLKSTKTHYTSTSFLFFLSYSTAFATSLSSAISVLLKYFSSPLNRNVSVYPPSFRLTKRL